MLSTKNKCCIFDGKWSISSQGNRPCLQLQFIWSSPREGDDILVLCCEPGGGLGEEPREIGSIMQFPNTWTDLVKSNRPVFFIFQLTPRGRE